MLIGWWTNEWQLHAHFSNSKQMALRKKLLRIDNIYMFIAYLMKRIYWILFSLAESVSEFHIYFEPTVFTRMTFAYPCCINK